MGETGSVLLATEAMGTATCLASIWRTTSSVADWLMMLPVRLLPSLSEMTDRP